MSMQPGLNSPQQLIFCAIDGQPAVWLRPRSSWELGRRFGGYYLIGLVISGIFYISCRWLPAFACKPFWPALPALFAALGVRHDRSRLIYDYQRELIAVPYRPAWIPVLWWWALALIQSWFWWRVGADGMPGYVLIIIIGLPYMIGLYPLLPKRRMRRLTAAAAEFQKQISQDQAAVDKVRSLRREKILAQVLRPRNRYLALVLWLPLMALMAPHMGWTGLSLSLLFLALWCAEVTFWIVVLVVLFFLLRLVLMSSPQLLLLVLILVVWLRR